MEVNIQDNSTSNVDSTEINSTTVNSDNRIATVDSSQVTTSIGNSQVTTTRKESTHQHLAPSIFGPGCTFTGRYSIHVHGIDTNKMLTGHAIVEKVSEGIDFSD